MSEEDNCQVYQTEIEKLLKSDGSFIPFLGSFLTQVGFFFFIDTVTMVAPPSPKYIVTYAVNSVPVRTKNSVSYSK